MKKTNLILMIIVTLAVSVVSFGQERATAAQAFQQVDVVRVPAGCPRDAKPYVITHNEKTGTTPSSEMLAVMKQNNYRPAPRGFAEAGIDKWFIDTLPLGSCRICAASLVADLVNEGGMGTNDGLAIWLADPSAIYGPGMTGMKPTFLTATSVASGAVAGKPSLWGPPVAMSKILTLDLNVAGAISDANTANDTIGLPVLNNYIFTTTATPALDVFIQDDTRVNSLQLTVWR